MSLNRLSALVLILTPREISTATTEPTGLNRLSALVLILTIDLLAENPGLTRAGLNRLSALVLILTRHV